MTRFGFLSLTLFGRFYLTLFGCFSPTLTALKDAQQEIIENGRIELDLLAQAAPGSKVADEAPKREKKINKKMNEAAKQLDRLNQGKVGLLNVVTLAGYRVVQLARLDASSKPVRNLSKLCEQLKPKDEAMNYALYLLASFIGDVMLAVVVLFTVLGLGLGMGLGIKAALIGIVACGILVIFGYIPIDDVNTLIKKRAEEIDTEFPRVMSELSLLTVAGMEVNRAWKLVAAGGRTTLYQEMMRVSVDLDNNVPPEAAYGGMITRCNNPYTTKLATTVLQGISKDNSHVARMFRQLNDESWSEHKHNARRMGEKIQSKLLIPTMLMFVGILIVVLVPVFTAFKSGF